MDLAQKAVSYKVIAMGAEPESAQVLENELSSKEFDIRSADSLDQLAGILKQGIPDVMVLATNFSALDPFMLCSRLSKAGVVVLMLSEAPTREILIKAAKHGAMDVLVIPLQPGAVRARTDRALIKTGRKEPSEGLDRKIDFGLTKTPYDKVKVLVKNVKEVLALPFAVTKILSLCNDPSASAKDIEKPMTSDPAIAAMVMQQANSVAFSGSGRTTSIQRAIMRIGMRATRNIASSFSVFKLFSKEEKTFGFNRVWFWVHSLTTGICSKTLAALLKYPQPEDAFLAGLLHDIGKMILDDFLNEEFDKVLRIANSDGVPMRVAEQSVFETNHAYVGSKVADSWGFPSGIVEGIGRHHTFEKVAGKADKPSIDSIVCSADQMAKALLAGSGGDQLAEREASSLWNRFPKGLPWRKITEKVFEELRAYMEVLEIPPAQFQMELPEETRGKVGIFLPKAADYGPLLEIALARQGYEGIPFSSPEDQNLKEKGIVLIVGDLTSVENDEEAIQLEKRVSSLLEKTIILRRTDEKNRPLNLDFFWLESQLKQMMDHL